MTKLTKCFERFISASIASLLLVLVSCSSSTADGLSAGDSTGVPVPRFNAAPPSSGVGAIRVLDLGTGSVTNHDENFNLATLSADQIAFRRVNATEALMGAQPGSLGEQSDEAYQVVSVPQFYLAIDELTQAQWQALAGTSPWLTLGPSSAVGASLNDPSLPAIGFTAKEVTVALNTYNVGLSNYELDLPTAIQWECACRSGASTPYTWGSSEEISTVLQYSIVRETRPSIGAQLVGQRLANAYGYRDMHGNTWELIKDRGPGGLAIIKGGSWSDNLLSARAANRQFMDPDVAHGAVGLRLVLRESL